MAKKKKGEGPQRKRIKFEVNADIDQTRFLKVYDVQCNSDNSLPCPWLVKAMKKGIEDRRYTREVRKGMKYFVFCFADPNLHKSFYFQQIQTMKMVQTSWDGV